MEIQKKLLKNNFFLPNSNQLTQKVLTTEIISVPHEIAKKALQKDVKMTDSISSQIITTQSLQQ
jgi:hypothetical protein